MVSPFDKMQKESFEEVLIQSFVAVFKGAIWDCAEYENLCIVWRSAQVDISAQT